MVTIAAPTGGADSQIGMGHNTAPSLAEFESALLLAADAYRRWIVAGLDRAGQAGLSPLEALFLLILTGRDEPLSFAELCTTARVAEAHLAHYALRKLQGLGLVQTARQGKRKTVGLTDRGHELTANFHALYGALLDAQATALSHGKELGRMADAMRELAAFYERAKQATQTC